MNRPLRDPRGGRFRYSARRRSVLRRRWRRTVSENLLRFGSDRDARRSEDGPLLTGRGCFTDDVSVPGQAHAAFVRAQVGHAELCGRSEEHTSELQSLAYLVCRLLLEKKKQYFVL